MKTVITDIALSPISMADDTQSKEAREEAKKEATKERTANSGRKGVPFFGHISDLGEKDQIGVGTGK
jgi:hypothetical protein